MAKQTRIPEKVVQAHITKLLVSLGAKVYTLGTRRPRTDYQGTCQTPGLTDMLVFLPARGGATEFPCTFGHHQHATREEAVACASGRRDPAVRRLLFVECKAAGGRLSEAQREFGLLCIDAQIDHVVGDLDAVIVWLLANGYLRRDQVPHYRLPPNPDGEPIDGYPEQQA